MRLAFFVSSLGDTHLAKATITQLIDNQSCEMIFLNPLTYSALRLTDDFPTNNKISIIPINKITNQDDTLSRNQISSVELKHVSNFIHENNIEHTYIGVPSISNEMPFQIANQLHIPCTIAYEYMFKPINHVFWNYVDNLVIKDNCDFAVPLVPAKNDILQINYNARVHVIGHIAIDQAQTINTMNSPYVKETLSIKSGDKFIFISGSTLATEVDKQFLDALLYEMSTGKYPDLQLRMGLHPGINDTDSYLQNLLDTCTNYPMASDQFKIILTSEFEKKLQQSIFSNPFILRKEISGLAAAHAANKVTQAVPGALLNEAVLMGKPGYFHDKSIMPYLTEKWFSENISDFYNAKQGPLHSRKELGLSDTAPNLLAKLLLRRAGVKSPQT